MHLSQSDQYEGRTGRPDLEAASTRPSRQQTPMPWVNRLGSFTLHRHPGLLRTGRHLTTQRLIEHCLRDCTRLSLKRRAYSTTDGSLNNIPPAPTESKAASPRWLADQKARLGKCIMFGLSRHQADEAGKTSQILGQEWQGLTAGADGFLVKRPLDEGSPSAWQERVVWGEMV